MSVGRTLTWGHAVHNNALSVGLLDKSIQDCVSPAGHAVPDDLALVALATACSAGRAEDGAAAGSVIRVPRPRGAREHLADAVPHGGAHRGPRSGARGLLGDLPAFGEVGFVARHVAALGIDDGAVGAGCEAERDCHEGETGYRF